MENGRCVEVEDARRCFDEESTAEAVVSLVMQEVVHGATNLMISNHFDSLSIPYTVRCVTKEVLDFVRTALVGQDGGYARENGWAADAQASPIVTDSWARNAIAVAPKAVDPGVPHIVTSQASGVLSSKPKPSISNPGALSTTSVVDRRNERKSTVVDGSEKARGRAKVSEQHPSLEVTRNSSIQMSREEAEYVQEQTEEQQKRAEIRSLSEKISKQIEELKTKDFVVDSVSGRVLPLKQIDPKAIPSRKVELRFSVPSATIHATDDLLKPPRAPSISKGKANVKRPKRDAAEFCQEEATYGPMIDGFVPTGGVSVKDGEVAKRNELKLPKNKLSRAEYRKLVESNLSEAQQATQQSEQRATPTDMPLPLKGMPNDVKPRPTRNIDQSPTVIETTTHSSKLEWKSQRLAALPARREHESSPARESSGISPLRKRALELKDSILVPPQSGSVVTAYQMHLLQDENPL